MQDYNDKQVSDLCICMVQVLFSIGVYFFVVHNCITICRFGIVVR